jgi:uncharacterized protein YqjF (DUF2071 family)
MVGFQFLDTRLLGVPIPFHRNFLEVNLRFYVRREVAGDLRRGVVFVKEIVPRYAVSWVANRLYNEKYVTCPMSHHDDLGGPSRTVRYQWSLAGTDHHLQVSAAGDAYIPADNSEDTFITEHYWGYTAQPDGSTLEYGVEHPRWSVWQGTDPEFHCDVARLYGERFVPFLKGRPSSCFLADGSAIVVRRGVRVVPEATDRVAARLAATVHREPPP